MARTTVLSVNDGPQTTVRDLTGAPLAIPARVLEVTANNFISEALLRNEGPNPNGLVSYSESVPLYLGSDLEEVAEFSEIPVATGQLGTPRVAVATKKGLGIRISREMRDENRIGQVNTQITQLKNTLIRSEERALRRILLNPAIPTIAATGAWNGPSSRVRRDIANAMEVIASARPDGRTRDDDELMNFLADTIALPSTLTPALIDNEEFLKVYSGDSAGDSIAFTGKLPNDILGLSALQSRSWPNDRVLVLERGTVGFYSDTRPLEVTELYPEGNGPNGGSTETWRSDATRKRAMGIDQPLAACWITGVQEA